MYIIFFFLFCACFFWQHAQKLLPIYFISVDILNRHECFNLNTMKKKSEQHVKFKFLNKFNACLHPSTYDINSVILKISRFLCWIENSFSRSYYLLVLNFLFNISVLYLIYFLLFSFFIPSCFLNLSHMSFVSFDDDGIKKLLLRTHTYIYQTTRLIYLWCRSKMVTIEN